MSVDLRTVDEIVQRVMDQLRFTAPAPSVSVSAPLPTPNPSPVIKDQHLTFTEKVITGPLLEARLSGQKTIVILPRAIITPTAQDIIRTRSLTCLRENPPSLDSTTRAKWRILISAAAPEGQRAAEELLSRGELHSRQLVACTQDAIRQATTQLSRAEIDGIVGLVREPIRAAGQSNRQSKIRAAAIHNLQTLEEARHELNPNLLWINPLKNSWFELKNLLTACVAGDRPSLPKGWNE